MLSQRASTNAPEAAFYLVNNGSDHKFRINFMTAGGQRWMLDADDVVQPDTW